APMWLNRRSAKVATPATAATVLVPDRVSPPGLMPSATVTLLVYPLTVLPIASFTATRTAGVIATPVNVLVGWVLIVRLTAALAGSTGVDPPHAASARVIPLESNGERRNAVILRSKE